MLDHVLIAGALMLVIEGTLYALFPDLMRKAIAAALDAPSETLRFGGVIAISIGVLVVWLVKGG